MQLLVSDRYSISKFHTEEEFFSFIEQKKQQIDCLVLHGTSNLYQLLNQLNEQEALLPTLVLKPELEKLEPEARHNDELTSKQPSAGHHAIAISASANLEQKDLEALYHTAIIQISTAQLSQIDRYIDQALDQFLKLSPACALPDSISATPPDTETPLVLQQQRLAEKLKERLGYLGVYYKRNPQNFLRHMEKSERQEFLQKLRQNYRQIVLSYFSNTSSVGLNQKIDDFVNVAFFADISVAQIVEVHMELMDEFAKQLKLEGRSEEILLDYRLTLIDTIAHLCEMYRRSIPRES